jgi:type IV pilus assembly protein PilE
MSVMRARGFTLIELMVVVAIVGILAAVAYPAYTDSVLKGKRTSAKARMTEVAGRLQQFYSEQTSAASYTTDLSKLGYSSTLLSESKSHAITVEAGATGIASSYKILATPTPAGSDPKCGVLSLDSLGTTLPAGC